MFYPNQFVDQTEKADTNTLLQSLWQQLASQFHLQAILLLRCYPEHRYFVVESAFGVPAEPFNGSDKELLSELLEDCFAKHAKPHIHSLSGSKLPGKFQKFNQHLKDLHRVWFFPLKHSSSYFVFLGFPDSQAEKKLVPELEERVAHAIFTLFNCLRSEELYKQIETTERFVKEVGHDFASSVQAIIAKLRTITERRVTGEGIFRKSHEIEDEMWNAYRVSESLGIVVDPAYQLKEPATFNLIEALEIARTHHLAEAAERHMKLVLETNGTINVWGDKKAITQAIEQLLSNAIKYGKGDSSVQMSATERRDDVLIRVTNQGIPLPTEPELYFIWDFGFRGKTAKELHVNGSGIGLYSVKKIATAHLAKVAAECQNGVTSFFIHLPPEAKLKQALGLLF